MPAAGLVTASAVLGAAKGGAQLYSSLHKLGKDKEELAKLKPAFYKVQDEYYQDKNQAAEMVQGGIPAATRDYATTEGERGLGAGIKGITASGGNPSDISHLFDSYDRSIDRISSADAQAHLDNIKYFTQANKELAGQKTTQWGVNEYKPYQDKLSELTARRGADEKSAWNGASGIIGSVGALGTSMQNTDLLKSITSKNNAQTDFFSSLFNNGTQGAAAGMAGVQDPFTLPSQHELGGHTDTATAGNGQNPSYEELLQMFKTFRKK